jgi:hypothetical protein
LSCSEELAAGARWHPVAGEGPHGGGSVVVDVVDGAAVVDVEVLDDELLLVDVLLLVDELLLEVDVLLVLLVDVDDVVVVVTGPPPISQFVPEMPGGHTQR